MNANRRLASLALALAATAATGCPSPPAPPPPPPSVERAATWEGPISVIDSGHWAVTVACSGICVNQHNFWVDLAVRNDAYAKQVGILWTPDGWATVKTAYAHYKGDLGDGFEKWGLDQSIGTFWDGGNPPPKEVEYAAFVTMAGQTSWEPHNNYYVYRKVTAAWPVQRLWSEVHGEDGLGVVMTGRVRVFDFAYDKKVVVRYSTDAWTTWKEAEAHWVERQDWEFRVEGLGATPQLPERVEYAVRYEVLGKEHWDSNNGANYVHRLDPRFRTNDLGTDPLSGIYTFSGAFQTDVATTGLAARLDDGAWQPVDKTMPTFSTEGLADGPHQVEFRLSLTGGMETIATVPFTVRNRLARVSDWVPQVTVDGQKVAVGTAWDLFLDPAGRAYFTWSQYDQNRVLRYPAVGSDEEPFRFDPFPPGYTVWNAAADADGRVWGVSAWSNRALLRWTADGKPDAAFGQAGIVPITGALHGREVCYLGQMALGPSHVYVADTCNERILRFGLDGAFDGSYDLPADDPSIPGALAHDGTGLWVMRARSALRFEDAADASPMVLKKTVSFQGAFEFQPNALAATAGGALWGAGIASKGAGSAATPVYNAVAVVGGAGDLQTLYSGGTNDLPGGLEIPRAVRVADGGDVLVLGVQGCRVVRFEGALR